MDVQRVRPTVAHYFMRVLIEAGRVRRVYTQNIDMLERTTGIADSDVVYAHGNTDVNHCLSCDKIFGFDWMQSSNHAFFVNFTR